MNNKPHPLYDTWVNMRQRCSNPNHKNYDRYGGRGIKVCERWESFENFLADMGPRPEGMSLERKDNDLDYCPSNCVWATRRDQYRNRCTNVFYTFEDTTLCIRDWADFLKIDPRKVKSIFPLLPASTSVKELEALVKFNASFFKRDAIRFDPNKGSYALTLKALGKRYQKTSKSLPYLVKYAECLRYQLIQEQIDLLEG